MADPEPPGDDPTPEQLARRIAELETSYAATAAALARVQAELAGLVDRMPRPPPKVIPWWAFLSFLFAWGIVFHLLVR